MTLTTDTEAESRHFLELPKCQNHVETLSIQVAFEPVSA